MALKPRKKAKSIPKTKTAVTARRVLYVEDEEINWKVAQAWLSKDYRLIRACDAKETFEQLRSNGPFSLILMDVQLKGSDLDGVAITQLLRKWQGRQPPEDAPDYAQDIEFDAKTPIYFLTGNPEDDLSGLGADEVFTKPIDFLQLTATMVKHLPTPPATESP